MFRYILFDLDGTLTDPFEGISKCIIYALKDFEVPAPDTKTLEGFIGPPLFEQFKAQFGFTDEQAEQAVKKYRERYSSVGWKECTLVKGAKEALRSLKENGLTAALATSKPEGFAKKILEYFEIDKYFDFIGGAEFEHTGRNKKEDIIGYVLQKLGVKNKSAAIMVGDRFYDIDGARANGIETIAFLGGYGSREEFERCGAAYIASDMEEVKKIVLSKEINRRCIIIGAGGGASPEKTDIRQDDFVIAADGGYAKCRELGITPHLAVGDWDSLKAPPTDCPTAVLPVEKDDTDTLAAIRKGLEKGCEEFHIYFGTGGKRFDHTVANMQCLVFLSKQNRKGFLYGENSVIAAVTNGSVRFSETAKGDISVFAADGTALGVTETGLKYSLKNAAVTSDFPIGISNSFTGSPSEITVTDGTLYIIFPRGEFPL